MSPGLFTSRETIVPRYFLPEFRGGGAPSVSPPGPPVNSTRKYVDSRSARNREIAAPRCKSSRREPHPRQGHPLPNGRGTRKPQGSENHNGGTTRGRGLAVRGALAPLHGIGRRRSRPPVTLNDATPAKRNATQPTHSTDGKRKANAATTPARTHAKRAHARGTATASTSSAASKGKSHPERNAKANTAQSDGRPDQRNQHQQRAKRRNVELERPSQ